MEGEESTGWLAGPWGPHSHRGQRRGRDPVCEWGHTRPSKQVPSWESTGEVVLPISSGPGRSPGLREVPREAASAEELLGLRLQLLPGQFRRQRPSQVALGPPVIGSAFNVWL